MNDCQVATLYNSYTSRSLPFPLTRIQIQARLLPRSNRIVQTKGNAGLKLYLKVNVYQVGRTRRYKSRVQYLQATTILVILSERLLLQIAQVCLVACVHTKSSVSVTFSHFCWRLYLARSLDVCECKDARGGDIACVRARGLVYV